MMSEAAHDAEFLTTLGAAKVLDVDSSTVRSLERRGVLRCARASGGQRLFDPADVRRLAEHRAETRRAAVLPSRGRA